MVIQIEDTDFQLIILCLGIAGGTSLRDGHPELLRNTIRLANELITQKEQIAIHKRKDDSVA